MHYFRVFADVHTYLCSAFKLMALQVTNEALGLLVFLNLVLDGKVCTCWSYSNTFITHSLVSELRECIHNDTEHNVQTNGGDNDKETQVEQQSPSNNVEFRT